MTLMPHKRPIASLSLDLDNNWSYLKTHGDAIWESFPSYFDTVIPRILDFMEKRRQKMTVFIVGQDAALDKNKESLSWIPQKDHEIGNHSFNHEPWLHLYTPEQLDEEFRKTEEVLKEVTGVKPVGFRGPGFSLTDQVLKTLIRRGYEYDCSTFPTFLGPAARAFYFMTSTLSKKQQEERKALFGSMSDGFQSNYPYMWDAGTDRIVEIPVTTFPLFKTPMHMSYLNYLAKFSKTAARVYFWSAVRAAKLAGVGPSLLLHPTDFLGSEDDINMEFFPGMDKPSEFKIELLGEVLDTLDKHFELVPMREHANAARESIRKKRSISTAVQGVQPATNVG